MAVRPLFQDVVSVLVAFRDRDGNVYWLGGECEEMSVSISTRIDTEHSLFYGPGHIAHPPKATVCATITNYTGEWRRGVPDVAALGAGDPLLPPPARTRA